MKDELIKELQSYIDKLSEEDKLKLLAKAIEILKNGTEKVQN